MPNRRKQRSMRRPRNGRRRPRLTNALTSTRHVIPPFFRTKVAYSIRYRETDGTPLGANTVFYQFLGNSVFNPDLNTTFERYPIGIPQWSQMYQRYYVQSSKIDVRVQPQQGLTLGESMFVIYPHAYTSVLPGGALHADDFVGQPFASRVYTAGPVSAIGRGSMARTSALMFSRPESQVRCSEDTSGFLVSSSYQPNNQWYWTVVFSGQKDDATLMAQAITFTIEYNVILFQPNALVVTTHDTTGSFVENTPDTVLCAEPQEEKKEEI